MADHNEVVFETEICEYLAAHGWLYSANDTGYDRERALFPEDLFAWLEETQQVGVREGVEGGGVAGEVPRRADHGARQAAGAWRRDAEHPAQRGAVHRRWPVEDGAVPARDDAERDDATSSTRRCGCG